MKTIGVYLLKQKEKVVYVGQSIDVDLRITTHKREKIKVFDNVHIIKCDRNNLDSAEAFYIHYYSPQYNKKLYEMNIGDIPPLSINRKRKKENVVVSEYDKPTDTNIGEYFGLTRQTIGAYKRSKDIRHNRRYEAMREYFIKIKG